MRKLMPFCVIPYVNVVRSAYKSARCIVCEVGHVFSLVCGRAGSIETGEVMVSVKTRRVLMDGDRG